MKKSNHPLFILYLIIGLGFYGKSEGQRWTFSDTLWHNNRLNEAKFYLPNSAAGEIRGLIICANTLAEELFLEHSTIRALAEEEKLGLILIKPSPVSSFGTGGGLGTDTTIFNRIIEKLITESGHEALGYLPFLTFGHSTSSAFARNMAWWKPERTLGSIVFKGGAIRRPSWASKSLAHVPMMAISGQFEEYGPNGGCAPPRGNEANYRACADSILKLRAGQDDPVLGMGVMLPGEGHFALSEAAVTIMRLFIKKCLTYRLPTSVSQNEETPLLLPNEETAWYGDSTFNSGPMLIDTFPNIADPTQYFFLFDREFASAWKALHEGKTTRIRQNIAPNGQSLSLTNTSQAIRYEDCSGMTYRADIRNGAETTLSVTTPQSGLELNYQKVSGPIIQTGSNTFRSNFLDNYAGNSTYLNIFQQGDETYNFGERTIRVVVTNRTSGTAQVLSVDPIADKEPNETFSINYTNSSGLTPEIFIVSGPAILNPNGSITTTFHSGKNRDAWVKLRVGHPGDETFSTSNIVELKFKVSHTPLGLSQKKKVQKKSQISPNPTKGFLRIKSEDPISSIELIDATGRSISNWQGISDNSTELNLSAFSSGLYFLKINHLLTFETKIVVLE